MNSAKTGTKKALIAAVIAAMALPMSGAVAADYSCAKDPHLVGACFMLHGRLEKMANSSRIKLWHIGTKRIYGVQYPGNMPEVGGQFVELPANIRDNWDDTSEYLFGDFRVCPFSKSEPGIQQFVCIDSAEHLVKQDICRSNVDSICAALKATPVP